MISTPLSVERMAEALANVVSAWNTLSIGYHSGEEIENWLRVHMKPAIDTARDVPVSSPTLPDVAGAKEPPCQFGCKQAVGLYHLPRGCPCFDTKEQWLCEQHLVKLRNNGYEAIPIFERPRALPDVAGAGEQELALIIDGIIRDIAELPDRTSPPDQPDVMLVSDGELRSILWGRLEALTSAHLSGVREGREETARCVENYYEWCGRAKTMEGIVAAIRALPPPKGERE